MLVAMAESLQEKSGCSYVVIKICLEIAIIVNAWKHCEDFKEL